jgi:hypothetical protein
MPTYSEFDIPKLDTQFDLGKQKKEQEQYLSGFRKALAGQERLPAMRERYAETFGLPQLREREQDYSELAGNLASQIRALPEDVAGRTRESLVTDPQRQRIIQKQQEPLLQGLQDVGTLGAQTAQQISQRERQLGTMMGLEQAQQNRELMPWQQKYDLMNVNQAREMTGWTFGKEMELNRLLNNAQMGMQLDQAEQNRLHQLAMQEQDFENRLEEMEFTQDLDQEFIAEQGVFMENLFGEVGTGWL